MTITTEGNDFDSISITVSALAAAVLLGIRIPTVAAVDITISIEELGIFLLEHAQPDSVHDAEHLLRQQLPLLLI